MVNSKVEAEEKSFAFSVFYFLENVSNYFFLAIHIKINLINLQVI